MLQVSAENLKQTWPDEKENWPQRHKVRSWQVPHFPKGIGPSVQITSEAGKSQGERRPHLGKKKGVRVKAWGGKNGLHGERWWVPERRGMASKENVSRRGSMSG